MEGGHAPEAEQLGQGDHHAGAGGAVADDVVALKQGVNRGQEGIHRHGGAAVGGGHGDDAHALILFQAFLVVCLAVDIVVAPVIHGDVVAQGRHAHGVLLHALLDAALVGGDALVADDGDFQMGLMLQISGHGKNPFLG